MPIPIMAAIAVAQAAMAAGKAISGGIQKAKAKKALDAMPRPQMQIPAEAQAALLNSQKQSLMTSLPGSDIMQQNIDRNTMANVNSLGEVSTGGSLLEATNRAYQSGANQITNLDLAGAQFNQANQGAYRSELGQMANLKNQQFQVNQLDPYNQRRAELNNQRDAGNQNLWGGINSAAQAAGSYLGMSQEQKNFDTYFKGQQTFGQQPNAVQPFNMNPIASGGIPQNIVSGNFRNPALNTPLIGSQQQQNPVYNPWAKKTPFTFYNQ